MTVNATAVQPRADWVEELKKALGVGAVITDDHILDAYAVDAWPVSVVRAKTDHVGPRPEAVVMPRTVAEVREVLDVSRACHVPVTARGLGSSVTGQPLPSRGGIVLDLSALTGEPRLDLENLLVTVPAGTLGLDLEEWLNARGLTLSHFPQSLNRSSVGGWVATRATGQLSTRFGGIEHLAVGFDVLLCDGTLLEMGAKPRSSVGPDLSGLFIGSEGTLGIVVSVTMKVFPLPAHVSYECFILPTVRSGLEAIREMMQGGLRPALLRFYDPTETRHAAPGLPASGCALFLGSEGTFEGVVTAEHDACTHIIESHGGQPAGAAPVRAWMGRRFDFSTVESLLAEPGGYAETIEVAHRWDGIDALYAALTQALAPYADEVLGHFSHAYHEGVSLYVILLGRAPSDEEALSRLASIWEIANRTTLEQGGELSHHHGAGLARAGFVRQALGTRHDLLHLIKAALDPDSLLNPGKLDLDSV